MRLQNIRNIKILIIIAVFFASAFITQAGLVEDLYSLLGKYDEKKFGASVLFPYQGGTGTSTSPSYGNILVGTSGGVYQLQATSTLGITAAASVSFLNDIGDVATTSPTNYGDLLLWNGSNWTNNATSTLGITAVETDPYSLHLTDWYATTTHALISSLPSLSITESQISDLDHFTGSDFYTFFNATNTDALSEGSTNFYATQPRWDSFWNASATLTSVTSIPNLSLGYAQISDFRTGWDSIWNASTTLSSVTSIPNLAFANDAIDEADILFSTACAAGNHYYLNGTNLACEADDNTVYSAGNGLQLIGTVFSIDNTYKNTWTTKQTFNYASTTQLSVSGILYDYDGDTGQYGNLLTATGSGINWVATSTLNINVDVLNNYFSSTTPKHITGLPNLTSFGTLTGLTIGTATSTASNGFDISEGCFAIGGTCLSTDSTDLTDYISYSAATNSLTTLNGLISIGTAGSPITVNGLLRTTGGLSATTTLDYWWNNTSGITGNSGITTLAGLSAIGTAGTPIVVSPLLTVSALSATTTLDYWGNNTTGLTTLGSLTSIGTAGTPLTLSPLVKISNLAATTTLDYWLTNTATPVLTAGRSLTLTAGAPDTINADTELYTGALTFNISTTSPVATTTAELCVDVPVAITIIEASGYTDAGTSTIQFDQRSTTTPNTAGTDILSAVLTVGRQPTANTNSFNDATVPAGYIICVDIEGNKFEGASKIKGILKYTKDD